MNNQYEEIEDLNEFAELGDTEFTSINDKGVALELTKLFYKSLTSHEEERKMLFNAIQAGSKNPEDFMKKYLKNIQKTFMEFHKTVVEADIC